MPILRTAYSICLSRSLVLLNSRNVGSLFSFLHLKTVFVLLSEAWVCCLSWWVHKSIFSAFIPFVPLSSWPWIGVPVSTLTFSACTECSASSAVSCRVVPGAFFREDVTQLSFESQTEALGFASDGSWPGTGMVAFLPFGLISPLLPFAG